MKTVDILLNMVVTGNALCDVYYTANPAYADWKEIFCPGKTSCVIDHTTPDECIPEYVLGEDHDGLNFCPSGYMPIQSAKDCQSAASASNLYRAGDAYVQHHNLGPQVCFRGGHEVSLVDRDGDPNLPAEGIQICREAGCVDNDELLQDKGLKGGCSQLLEMHPDACQGDGIPALCPSSCKMCASTTQAELFGEATMTGDAAMRNHQVFAGATGSMLGGIVVLAALKIRNSMRRTDDAYDNLEA